VNPAVWLALHRLRHLEDKQVLISGELEQNLKKVLFRLKFVELCGDEAEEEKQQKRPKAEHRWGLLLASIALERSCASRRREKQLVWCILDVLAEKPGALKDLQYRVRTRVALLRDRGDSVTPPQGSHIAELLFALQRVQSAARVLQTQLRALVAHHKAAPHEVFHAQRGQKRRREAGIEPTYDVMVKKRIL
jgi:hypothetical protein